MNNPGHVNTLPTPLSLLNYPVKILYLNLSQLLWGNLQSEDESSKVFEIFQFKIELKFLHKINFCGKCENENIWDESKSKYT